MLMAVTLPSCVLKYGMYWMWPMPLGLKVRVPVVDAPPSHETMFEAKTELFSLPMYELSFQLLSKTTSAWPPPNV